MTGARATELLGAVDWTAILLGLWLGIGVLTAGHALLTRRDPRAAWGWIAACWLFPFAGPALYLLFGIERLRSQARRLGMHARDAGAIGPDHAQRFARGNTEADAIHGPVVLASAHEHTFLDRKVHF